MGFGICEPEGRGKPPHSLKTFSLHTGSGGAGGHRLAQSQMLGPPGGDPSPPSPLCSLCALGGVAGRLCLSSPGVFVSRPGNRTRAALSCDGGPWRPPVPRWPGHSHQTRSPWRSRATVERPAWGHIFTWELLAGTEGLWKGLGLGNIQIYMSGDF